MGKRVPFDSVSLFQACPLRKHVHVAGERIPLLLVRGGCAFWRLAKQQNSVHYRCVALTGTRCSGRAPAACFERTLHGVERRQCHSVEDRQHEQAGKEQVCKETRQTEGQEKGGYGWHFRVFGLGIAQIANIMGPLSTKVKPAFCD